MTKSADGHRHDAPACDGCPIVHDRRAFLRDAAAAAAAAIAAVSILTPARAFAEAVREIAPASARLLERTYAIPAVDGVSIDLANAVLIARWENRLYAFSMKCPHKGARLEWRGTEERVYCPRHKARFLADGSHVSGRGRRDLDRYAIRRTGTGLVVDLGQAFRQDREPEAWQRARLSL